MGIRMSTLNRVVLSCSLTMLCVPPAFSQVDMCGVEVDGSAQEWKGWEHADSRNVAPVQVDAIDLSGLRIHVGRFHADRESLKQNPIWETRVDGQGKRYHMLEAASDWSIMFALKFDGAVMEGEEETMIEILFDVYPSESGGVAEPLWNMHADYRFAAIGKGGRITRELYQVGHTGAWVGAAVLDAPEFDAAVQDRIFECMVPWPSLGNPLDPPGEGRNQSWVFMCLAIRITRGANHDYLPRPEFVRDGELGGRLYLGTDFWQIITKVGPQSWADAKREMAGWERPGGGQ
jgi:hypothetical protein